MKPDSHDHVAPAALTTLERIAVSLGKISDESLAKLRYATTCAPAMAPELLTWITHAVIWEMNRRASHAHELRVPPGAVSDEGPMNSLWALGVLSDSFVLDEAWRPPDFQAISEFLNATRSAITASSLH